MSTRRQIRELVVQALYQLDARGLGDIADIERSIIDAPHAEATKREAIDLAKRAWTTHEPCDELTTKLAPDWPAHRQPPVDKSILRLAYYEIVSGAAPVAVAINEAIELAREFGSDRSAAFVNGVLDKMAKHLRDKPADQTPGVAADPNAWLNDAMTDARDVKE
jgi:N utilization substance protein B